jgi:hypothetical protein
MTEYNDLIKQADEHNKKLCRTKDFNVCDVLTDADRQTIAHIIDCRVAQEYGDLFEFKWQFQCTGHFICK